MKRIPINDPDSIKQAVETLLQGGVAAHPTDTIYGLAADAENEAAVARVYAVKGRDPAKDLLIAVPNLDVAQRYVHITPLAKSLAQKYLPGPLSLVLARKNDAATAIGAHSGTIGIRLPAHPWMQGLMEKLDCGITSTSVNRSGAPPLADPGEIGKELGEEIDLLVDANILSGAPSTVVEARGEKPVILRQGSLFIEK